MIWTIFQTFFQSLFKEEPAPQLLPADFFQEEAEWDVLITGLRGRVSNLPPVHTHQGDFRVRLKFPPGSWDPEGQRFTRDPIKGVLRSGHGYQSRSLSYSEFRAQFPDTDPLPLVREFLQKQEENDQCYQAALEIARVGAQPLTSG